MEFEPKTTEKKIGCAKSEMSESVVDGVKIQTKQFKITPDTPPAIGIKITKSPVLEESKEHEMYEMESPDRLMK